MWRTRLLPAAVLLAIGCGPHFSKPGATAAAGLAALTAACFVQEHVPAERRGEVGAVLRAIEEERTALAQLAAARGWTGDPFPGRW